jgi:hypothetical protein
MRQVVSQREVSQKMRRNKDHAEIGKLTNEIVSEAGQSTGLNIKFEIANEDAKKILKEVQATIAKQKPKKRTTLARV